jgi:hypothetical protein
MPTSLVAGERHNWLTCPVEVKSSKFCDWWSVGQFVLVLLVTLWDPQLRCSYLGCCFESCRTHNHILLSPLRLPATWRAKSAARHWVPFLSPLTTHGDYGPGIRTCLVLTGFCHTYINFITCIILRCGLSWQSTSSSWCWSPLGPMNRFVLSHSVRQLLFLHVQCAPWLEDRSITYSYKSVILPGQSLAELMRPACCLLWGSPFLSPVTTYKD